MAPSKPNIAAATIETFDALIATAPGVERKGASMPYTSCNGHMFSFLTPDGMLALRLPSAEREAFLKTYRTTLCEQHGVVMNEYVTVPRSLFEKTQDLRRFFEISRAYVASLKPKPTTRTSKTSPKAKGKKAARKSS
jgi:hypothetical protein